MPWPKDLNALLAPLQLSLALTQTHAHRASPSVPRARRACVTLDIRQPDTTILLLQKVLLRQFSDFSVIPTCTVISFSHGLEMEFIVVFSFTLKIHLSCLHTIIRDERQLGVG